MLGDWGCGSSDKRARGHILKSNILRLESEREQWAWVRERGERGRSERIRKLRKCEEQEANVNERDFVFVISNEYDISKR